MNTVQGSKESVRQVGVTNPPKFSGEQGEMMEKLEAAGKPGPAHKVLDALIGDWRAEVKCWNQPGTDPEVSQGSAKARWLLNGRFLEEDFQGSMMGRPFSGRTLLGYDNTKKVYNSVWISDTQTSMFISEGKAGEGNKVITLEGTATCPVRGLREMKSVLRFVGTDEHVFEMFDESEGGHSKMMEIRYTRR